MESIPPRRFHAAGETPSAREGARELQWGFVKR
jgi:hypothetical protein